MSESEILESPAPSAFRRLRAELEAWIRPREDAVSRGPQLLLVRWLFLRMLGLIYLAAFASLGTQIVGLVGEHGLLPVGEFLRSAQEQLGPEARWAVPTLCWLDPSDGFLRLLSVAGVVCSVLVTFGLCTAQALALCWALYLSLANAGQDFLGFQWDMLLLETGFLAIFFAPWQAFPGLRRERRPSTAILWLLRWLLFRLMFSSGAVKLLSGDDAWWGLTALDVHYETQPLPTWIGWWAHQLPHWFQALSTIGVFVIELGVPLLIVGPRKVRLLACGALAGLQLLILLTGNYCFFNWLTLALCLLLLDDDAVARMVPRRMLPAIDGDAPRRFEPVAKRALNLAIGGLIVALGVAQMSGTLHRRVSLPGPARSLLRLAQPFNLVNGYGLFAVMTTARMEIVLEGSADGEKWLEYEFRYKPGDVRRAPGFVAPHQPRLDWQMWFAALSSYQSNPWFSKLVSKLLRGEPSVLALLEKNPFPGAPPKQIRALFYQYRFTNPATRSKDGAWWTQS